MFPLAIVLFAFQITGRVTYDGKPLPGASVHLQNRVRVSDADGTFRFDNVKNGMYAITAEMAGYESVLRTVEVNDADVTVRIVMGPVKRDEKK